ncbi:hypothetical protein ACFLVL_02170 [Chloroflexota bacterium]
MGRNPAASPEELEFIFELFRRGLSDQEVQDEIANTEYSDREIRFIRERRRGFNAARKTVEDDVRTRADPITIEQTKKHYKTLADMAQSLTEELTLPPLSDILSEPVLNEYKFHDRLPCVVSEESGDSELEVFLPDGHEKPVNQIYRRLRAHLLTSDFSKTVEDIREWVKNYKFYLTKCYKLLDKIKDEVERTQGTKIPSSYSDTCGLTVWFPLTLCIDFMDVKGISKDWGYELKPMSGLFGLNFRGSTIAIARSKKDLTSYEKTHRSLRGNTAFLKEAEGVGKIENTVLKFKKQVTKELETFSQAIPIPGYCKVCKPSKREPSNMPFAPTTSNSPEYSVKPWVDRARTILDGPH